jgi:hypothetical protein
MRYGAKYLLAAVAALALQSVAAADDGFQWLPADAGHTDLLFNGKPALRYMHEPYDDSSKENRDRTYKPYHHVFSPDGATLLTKGPGGLYPHHRGVFYGFNKITYGDDQKCDTWHCTEGAHQSHIMEIRHSADADRAQHESLIHWYGAGAEPFANEQRQLSVSRPSVAGVEGWQIDFRSKLETTDGKPIHLDGDPQHAGFQFRATQEVPDKTAKETYYLRIDGKGKPGDYRNWEPKEPESAISRECVDRPWNALSIVVGGERYTIVYLDHPTNPKPSRYSERDYGRFGSYFVADVTKDKPLEVKYRLWVQAGEMTVEHCQALSDKFNQE